MSHFVNVRAGAVWAGTSDLLSAEMAVFDTQLFKAINGDGGGTWAPSAVITIGGSGMDVTGPFTAANIGTSTLSGTLGVASGGAVVWANGSNGVVLSGATVTILGDLQISAAGAGNNQLTILTGAFLVADASSHVVFNSKPKCNLGLELAVGTLQAKTGTSIQVDSGATVVNNGVTTRSGPELLSGASAGMALRAGTATNADTSYDCSKDWRSVAAGTSDWTYTLQHSGVAGSEIPYDGMTMTFRRQSTGVHTIDFRTEAAVNIAVSPISESWSITFIFTSGSWRTHSFGQSNLTANSWTISL